MGFVRLWQVDTCILIHLSRPSLRALSAASPVEREPEFYTLPAEFIREHHYHSGGWQQVNLRGLDATIAPYKNERGFELIAQALGVPRPSRAIATSDAQAKGAEEP